MKNICLIFAIFLLLGILSQTQTELLGENSALLNFVDNLTDRVFDILKLRKLKVISGGIIATSPDESQDFTDIVLTPRKRGKRSVYHDANELPNIHIDCVKTTPKLNKRVTNNKRRT